MNTHKDYFSGTDSGKDLKEILATKSGRRFLYQLISSLGFYDTSYKPGFSQIEMSFLEGNRNAGLTVLSNIVNADKKLYIKMIEENME